MNLKSRALSTEIDFGVMLVNICQIELALGDPAQAERALSEARGISQVMSAIVETPKVVPTLRRQLLKLARMVTAADKAVLQARNALAEPGMEDALMKGHMADRPPGPAVRAAASSA